VFGLRADLAMGRQRNAAAHGDYVSTAMIVYCRSRCGREAGRGGGRTRPYSRSPDCQRPKSRA